MRNPSKVGKGGINKWLLEQVFKHLPRDSASVNTMKQMCDWTRLLPKFTKTPKYHVFLQNRLGLHTFETPF